MEVDKNKGVVKDEKTFQTPAQKTNPYKGGQDETLNDDIEDKNA